MRYLVLLLVFLQGCCWSCKDDISPSIEERNKEGIIVEVPYVWKVPLEYTYIVNSENRGHGSVWAGANLYYKNGYLVGSNPKKAKSYYEFRAIETGKLIWQLPNDIVNSKGFSQGIWLDNFMTYQYNHYVINTNYRPFCINLKTGKVQWRLKNAKYWEFVKGGFEDKVFFEREYEKGKYALYEADILTGNHREVFKLTNKDPANIEESVIDFHIKPFRDKKGDLLIITTTIDVYKDKRYQYYLGLYNYTKKKWVYKDVLINTKRSIPGVCIYKDKIFLMARQGFACHRLNTGEEIWSDNSYNKHANSGPWHEGVMVGNKLILAMGSDFLMCLDMDANYKKVLWENRKYNVGNSVSQFHVLNDVVYFADGGSGRICAIDPHTGKFLWFLKSPDLKEYGSGAFFKTDIWVIPGKGGKKGKIITSTYRSGVCYEAIK